MPIERNIPLESDTELLVSLPVRPREREVLSLVWDAEQILQSELASDGSTGV